VRRDKRRVEDVRHTTERVLAISLAGAARTTM